MLPPGKHVVAVVTESWPSFAFRIGSLLVSSGIVALAALSLLVVAGLFAWNRLGARRAQRSGPRASEARP